MLDPVAEFMVEQQGGPMGLGRVNGDMFLCGLARRSISPDSLKRGICLTGLRGGEGRKAHRKLDDLYVRVAWLERAGKKVILVNADLLYIPDDAFARIREWVRSMFPGDQCTLVLNATHTHSAPHPGGCFFDGSIGDTEYQAFVLERIQQGILSAHEDASDARLFITKTEVNVGINRRKPVLKISKKGGIPRKKQVVSRPNPKGAVDSDLYVLKILKRGKTAGLILSNGCHPSILRGSAVSADFPGKIEFLIRERFSYDIPVLFLQGFGGNVRPRLLKPLWSFLTRPKDILIWGLEGRGFERNTSERHLDEVARGFVGSIEELRDEEYDEIDVELDSKEIEVDLPLGQVPERNHLIGLKPKTEGERKWLAHVLENYERLQRIRIRISRVDLSKECSFLCVPGEVFCEYSLLFKTMFPRLDIIPLGYCNGMVGYIPTAKAVKEGGYEVERAYKLFGMMSPFSEEVEEKVIEGVRNLYESGIGALE